MALAPDDRDHRSDDRDVVDLRTLRPYRLVFRLEQQGVPVAIQSAQVPGAVKSLDKSELTIRRRPFRDDQRISGADDRIA